MELWAYNSCHNLDFPLYFRGTKSGLEVDFVLGDGEIALEIKSASRVNRKDLRSLSVFMEEFKPKKVIVICNEHEQRITSK